MCFGPFDRVAENERFERSLQIDRELGYIHGCKIQNKIVKLLLLGCGDSGKEIIAKQMKITFSNSFSEEERIAYKEAISSNILQTIQTLVNQSMKFGYELLAENTPRVHRISDIPRDYQHFILTPSVADDITALWQDPAIQETFLRSSEYQLNDSTQYFMSSLSRISEKEYVPTEKDILRTKVRTTGIWGTIFEVEDIKFKLIDEGGLRSERRKWIHCFDDVTIILCVSLSEYDLTLYDDDTFNRLHESLKLFEEVCNSKWFAETTAFILFFTKKDIFAEKIKRVPLTVCFPDYTGSQSFEESSDFIVRKFMAVREVRPLQIYPFLMCETDTSNVTIVFNAVRDIILARNLKKYDI